MIPNQNSSSYCSKICKGGSLLDRSQMAAQLTLILLQKISFFHLEAETSGWDYWRFKSIETLNG